MSVAVSLSLLVLTGVFGVAGVAKLLDRAGTRRALEAFGAPRRLAPAGAVLLPCAELAIAAALFPPATARWGALAALAVLAVFCVAIARALRSGATPDCNCFGGLTQTEAGRGTLLRNVLLGALAAPAAAGAGGQPVGALSWIALPAAPDRPAIVGLVACVAVLSWFAWQLLRQNGRLLLQLEAQAPASSRTGQAPAADDLEPLERGSVAPAFTGLDLDGRPVSLDALLAEGRPVVLFFTDPACGACAPALEVVARAQRERTDELTLAVISRGPVERVRARAAQLGLQRVVPQDDEALFDAYRVLGVPGTVLVAPDGRLARPLALGAAAARELIESASGEPLSPRAEVAVA